MKRLFSFLLLALLILPTLSMTSCAANPAQHELAMAPMSDMPAAMASVPERTQEAYRFAAANPEPMKNVPCFCGCVKLGHRSNYDCYIKDAPANGKLVFDDHALGCETCVNITQDVMQMTRDGRAPPAIRSTIIKTYSQVGPPTE